MDNYNFDLKDAIKSGVSPEQMMKEFQEQLATAQKEVEAEKAATKEKNINLKTARKEFVDYAILYLVELDVLNQEILADEDMLNDLYEAVEAVEDEICEAFRLLLFIVKMRFGEEEKSREKKTKINADDVLKTFLSTL